MHHNININISELQQLTPTWTWMWAHVPCQGYDNSQQWQRCPTGLRKFGKLFKNLNFRFIIFWQFCVVCGWETRILNIMKLFSSLWATWSRGRGPRCSTSTRPMWWTRWSTSEWLSSVRRRSKQFVGSLILMLLKALSPKELPAEDYI